MEATVYTFVCTHAQLLSCVDSLGPHGLLPTRLLCPWHFPGKNMEVVAMSYSRDVLPHPEIKPSSPVSPAWTGRFFTTVPPGKPIFGGI